MKRAVAATIFALTFLVAAAPAAALLSPAAPDMAFGAFQRGFFQTAFQEAMKRVDVDKHDAPAMTLVAELQLQGLGVKQNVPEAMRWYRLAADEDDSNALFA